METWSALQRVGAVTTVVGMGSVVAGTAVHAEPAPDQADGATSPQPPTDEAAPQSSGTEGWASLDQESDLASQGILCYRLGNWTGPKLYTPTAIRAEVTYACAKPFGEYWLWVAQLQKRSGGTWQNYGSSEDNLCAPFGEVSLCGATDGARYSSGTYRMKVTFAYWAIGGTETAYSPTVTIR